MNVTESEDLFNLTIETFQIQRNKTYNWSQALKKLPSMTARESCIIACYSLIVLVSIFGNILVCNILARNSTMRSSTYIFIANLALSDFMMTVLNIPFNVARILLTDWPFGSFMCSFVPLVQVTSVYVSTFTMTCIAADRYRIISKPLRPRLRNKEAMQAMACVWILAILLALPHAIFNRIESIFTYRHLIRCRTIYPIDMSRWITLIAVITQYVLPLTVTGVLYCLIMARVWSRNALGAVTEGQLISQARAKRKTIKMLVLVVILFALCWLPLNVFNILREFNAVEFISKSSNHSTIFFFCHWLAMSSVCYNPFIYCWLNEHFRSGALSCLLCIKNAGRQLNSSFKSTKEFKTSSVRCDTPPCSVEYRLNSTLESRNDDNFSNTFQLVQYKPKRRTSSCRLLRATSNPLSTYRFTTECSDATPKTLGQHIPCQSTPSLREEETEAGKN